MTERLLEPTDLISTPRPRSLPGSGWGGVSVVIGAAIAAFLAQGAATVLWFPPTQLTTIWLPGGVMMAIALRVEPRRWVAVLPAAAAGQVLLFLGRGAPSPRSAILLGILSIVAISIPATVLQRVTSHRFSLGTFREFLSYLAVVVVGGSFFGSALFLLGAKWLSYRPATFLVWRTWVLSAVLGYLMLTPTLLLLRQEGRGVRDGAKSRRIEASILATCLVLASSVVFRNSPHGTTSWPLFALMIPPLLFWAALRFTALAVSASCLLVTLISTFGTARGLGPFTAQSAGANTLSLQLFMLGIGLPLIGLAVVLDEHRRTTSALQKTHARLLEIHRDLLTVREEEATRIARDLHDDVGQRLAVVSIGLSRLRRSYPDQEFSPGGDVGRLQEQTSSIARTLREISHRLHPAALEHVGLAASLQMKCDEVAEATGLEMHLSCEGETTHLPDDVALCLFRVAQEALANVVRHAEARRVTMVLHRGARAISLQVTDDGHGFEPGSPEGRAGLGLHSSTERVHLLKGTLSIQSAKGAGTRLRVNVPLPENVNA